MKKIILAICCVFMTLPGIAQIKLEENKTLPQGQLKGEVQNIANVGKYYANIVAYGLMCKFPESDNKLIFDSYFKRLSQYNLTIPERDLILKTYELEFKLTLEKNKGKNEKDSSCDKFRPEYNKIVEYLKK